MVTPEPITRISCGASEEDESMERKPAEMNLHQAVTYIAFLKVSSFWTPSKDGISLQKAFTWVGGSFLLVLMQILALAAIGMRSSSAVCFHTWQCGGMRVCAEDRGTTAKLRYHKKSCFHCNQPNVRWVLRKYLPETDDLSSPCHQDSWYSESMVKTVCPLGAQFTCPEDDELCNECLDARTNTFRMYSVADEMQESLLRMHFTDLVTMILCVIIVTYEISTEVRESTICRISRRRLFEEAKKRDGPNSNYRWWLTVAFTCLTIVHYGRRIILPAMLIFDSALLLLFHGSDATSICFNSLGLLFVLKVDNLLYQRIDQDDRERVETGRVPLTNDVVLALDWIKNRYICSLFTLSFAIVYYQAFAAWQTPLWQAPLAVMLLVPLIFIQVWETQQSSWKRISPKGGDFGCMSTDQPVMVFMFASLASLVGGFSCLLLLLQ